MNLLAFLLTSLIQFGFIVLRINSINLGLISQIEVVEEWGCHDTEIRLTCGHLDSKLAILEATFTPNCTHEECLRLDIKRLSKVFHTTPKPIKTHRHQAETEAGRKFLETLRKSPLETGVDDEEIVVIEEEDGTFINNRSKGAKDSVEEVSVELHTHHPKNPTSDHLVARKTSLRASLERLIIRYLRKLSPEDNYDYDLRKRSLRLKRSRRKRVKRSDQSRSINSINENRFELGSRNILVNATNDYDEIEAAELEKRRKEIRKFCPEQQRHVTSLDRYDLEHSYKNETDDQYNIRRVLNKRCSGRNHCSFIFNIDHPFSKVWESGVVRVKYVCMEGFRLNQYCGEHLQLGYELTAQEQVMHFGDGSNSEPVARFLRDAAYHSVKILKSGDEKLDVPKSQSNPASSFLSQSNESRKRKIKIHNPVITQDKVEDDKGVYSQDFKVLKILPSNLDDFNDFEKIGNEIYFRKDKDILEQPSDAFDHINEQQKLATDDHSLLFPTSPTSSASDRYQTTFQATQLQPTLSGVPTVYATSEGTTILHYPAPSYPNDNLPSEDSDFSFSTNNIQPQLMPTEANNQNEIESPYPTASQLLTTQQQPYKLNNQIDLPESKSYDEDEPIEDSEDSLEEDYDFLPSTRKSYSSIQRTAFRGPLLHGFIVTPGYPKFYVGETDCKWLIEAPLGNRIRLTILDISLRYEEGTCMDYVKIIDLDIGRAVFNSCAEDIRPIEVISFSNQIEVVVKTTTKFAYPKRGVLLHYTAVGCILPPTPKYGRLVHKTETTAYYECDSTYVFPDTGVLNRHLSCTDKHTWNKILPDCIDQQSAINSKGLFITNSRKRPPDIDKDISVKMGDKDADMVFDILIPILIMAGLLIVNGIVFAVIMKYRRRNMKNLEENNVELAEL